MTGWGYNVSHEFIHRTNSPLSVFLGRYLLSIGLIPDFSIEHVYGHHAFVGTDRDPATAKKGENVYKFFLRSTFFGHLSAWGLEKTRLRRRGNALFSLHNVMIRGYLMGLPWIALFYLASGWLGVTIFLSQALFSKFILEIVNYMEHYALVRKPSAPVKPYHSWNTNKRMSSMILFSLTRHSAHHEKATLPFWVLDPHEDAPHLPYGYLTAVIICMIPPLWFRVMDKSVKQWETRYA